MYFLCSAFIPQTSPGLVLLAWDPAVLLFVIPSLLFLPVLHHIQPLCQLFFPSSFFPIPFGLSPFLVTLVHRFSRSQKTWIVCPICTSSLSDLVRRSPICTLLSSSPALLSGSLQSRKKRCPQAHPLCCCISLSSPAFGSHPPGTSLVCFPPPCAHTSPKIIIL